MRFFAITALVLAIAMPYSMLTAYKKGKKQGWEEALNTSPVHEELELVCAGLWIGEQNKKYWEKEKRNAR